MSDTSSLHRPLDQKKLEDLFHKYFPVLVVFARKYLSDEDTAREIVQGVFISLWERRREIDFSKPIKSYLFTAVYNRCMNEWRNRKKTDMETDVESDHLYSEGEFTDSMETAEMEERIYKAIAALAPKSRKIFEMSRFEGRTYREISAELGIAQKTVETLMSRTLKTLREKLKDYLIIFIGWLIYFLFK